jgi:NTE family protein
MPSTLQRPRIGLALGGGMARGCAHVGVLRELEKNDIPIDLIALKIRWNHLGRVTVSKLGFNSSERTEEYIRANFPVTEFDKLRVPFGAVACDLQTGKMVVFTEGSLPLAIRASCALPIFYTPVMVNGRMMVDGGLVGHIPASVVRTMGADIVIAVDVNSQHMPIPQPTHLLTVMSQALAIMGRSSVGYLYQDADLVIRPEITHVRPDDLTKAAEMIAAGEAAARRVMPRLKQLLAPQKQGWLKRLFNKSTHDPRRLSLLDQRLRNKASS